MGDRGHIRFVEPWRLYDEQKAAGMEPPSVWVYSHWAGRSLPNVAAKAIEAARDRWGDPSYGTRMAIRKIGRELGGWDELSWGIGAGPDDPGDGGRVVEINMAAKTVVLVTLYGRPGVERTRAWTFEAFLESVPEWGDFPPIPSGQSEMAPTSPPEGSSTSSQSRE